MPKLYEQVIYSENGKEYRATVLAVRSLDHHTGANDEPHLHLGFFAPVVNPVTNEEKTVIGTHDQNALVQFRFDVVHESHEFGEAAGKVGLKGVYPGGRWKEIPKKNGKSASKELTDGTIQ